MSAGDHARQLAWLDDELDLLDERGLRRERRTACRMADGLIEIGGDRLLDFGSNDYLGLACDQRLLDAAQATGIAWGAGASPLVNGYTPAHAELERRLGEFENATALVFSSGYAANVGTISALAGPGDVILSDALNHASLIDGCRLSRAEVCVYPHADVAALEREIERYRAARRRLIVTDALFSMDGDWPPLVELIELARRTQSMLMIDEAHSTGVFGAGGRGLAEELGVHDDVAIRVGTLSKALGSIGGFVCGAPSLIEWLVHRARSYMFSTALPPAACEATLAALDIVRDEPQRRERLLRAAGDVRAALVAQGWNIGASASQIIPVIVGAPEKAVTLSRELRQRGLYVPAIRPPSVPPDTSRLRISLSAAHSPDTLNQLITALGDCTNIATQSVDALAGR